MTGLILSLCANVVSPRAQRWQYKSADTGGSMQIVALGLFFTYEMDRLTLFDMAQNAFQFIQTIKGYLQFPLA